jgi:DNA repair ATPase RecN
MLKHSILLKSQIGSQLQKTEMLRWILIEVWRLLDRLSEFQPNELKKHKPWFHEGYSLSIIAKETSQIAMIAGSMQNKWDNLNNVRHEDSRHFRNKRFQYLKDKMNELAMNSKNKIIEDVYRGISEVKRCCQPVSNVMKDENDDLLADSRNILN